MFRRLAVAALLCLATTQALAQTAGTWVLVTDLWGNPSYQTLALTAQGEQLQGVLDGDPLTGQQRGEVIEFTAIDAKSKARYVYVGRLFGTDRITGTADLPDNNHADVRISHGFTARRVPERVGSAPRRHEFVPTDFANEFSAHRTPVLTIWPGDTVHTQTIDSGGVDDKGVTRALFGNPQTGPFFVATADVGDTLAVRIVRLRLNRDWADSLDTIVGRALGQGLAAKAEDLGKPVRWKLDRMSGLASIEAPSDKLKRFAVPLHPMLGGLAVAPGFGMPPISTGDTGRFGGNMDFNEVVEGNTVYLPVQQPGALLYLGDAHALQGDGETSQYALETSMDVEFSVEVIKGRRIGMPRVESPTQIMVLGQAGSLDEALRAATTGMVQWLQQDYGLTLSECAQILGAALHYTVPNLAGRSVGVAAKLDKALLAQLPRK